MSTPSRTLIETTVDDLRRHAPFDAMSREHLTDIALNCELTYAAHGEQLLAPEDGLATHFYVIQRGEVTGRGTAGSGEARRVVLTEGECFPVWALISRRAVTLNYVASKDTFLDRPADEHLARNLYPDEPGWIDPFVLGKLFIDIETDRAIRKSQGIEGGRVSHGHSLS